MHLSGLDEAELDSFEALLNTPDQEVYDWLRVMRPFHPRTTPRFFIN